MWPEPSWETRVGNHPVLASIEVSSMDLKELKVCTVYSGISEQIKPLQLVGQEAESKFKPKFKPLPVIWQSRPKAIPEEN